MSERGVCICPACGCQFSDDQKAKYERMAKRKDGGAPFCLSCVLDPDHKGPCSKLTPPSETGGAS